MSKQARRLILFAAAVCWAAPALAERVADPPRHQSRHHNKSAEARAKLAKEKAESAKSSGSAPAIILVPRSDSLGIVPVFDPNRPVMLP